jgi:hypothetical protein
MFPNEGTTTKQFLIGQLIWIGIFLAVWLGISFVIPFPFSLPVIIGIFILIGYYLRRRALRKQKNVKRDKDAAQQQVPPSEDSKPLQKPVANYFVNTVDKKVQVNFVLDVESKVQSISESVASVVLI